MIKGSTDIYCIFGYPVSHSKSPLMHNTAFGELSIDACYVPFNVMPEDLHTAVKSIIALGIKGANITVPHKEAVLPILDRLSPEAQAIGAVNTIKNDKGTLCGFNTDGKGFIQSLRENRIDLYGKRVLVLGAGGASRAVVYSLLMEGAEVYIYNRTTDKALMLLNSLKTISSKLDVVTVLNDPALINGIDIIVNTTSLGIKSGDPMPIEEKLIQPNHIVCDLIYKRTLLLETASAKGCLTLEGSDMLLWQGVYAFQIWTGIMPPIQKMAEALIQGY